MASAPSIKGSIAAGKGQIRLWRWRLADQSRGLRPACAPEVFYNPVPRWRLPPPRVRPEGYAASELIVDDDAGTREAFSGLLRLEGFDTATAENGMGALTYAAQHSFDVGLVDLHLPDLSGVKVIKELRARGTHAALVIVTAFPALDSCFDAASAGADGYVDGPLLGDEICVVVRQALAGLHPVRHPARGAGTPHALVTKPAAVPRRSSDERLLEIVRIVEAELPTPWSIDAPASRVGVSASASVTSLRP